MSRYRRSQASGATFFFTVTLADRKASTLTDHIERLRTAYGAVAHARPFKTIAICVLPDHLHALWELPLDDADFSTRWSRIKSAFSRGLPAVQGRSASKLAKREKGIWQRRFWEHQIRDVVDLQRHLDYIHYNPVKHGLVSRVADWPYSSFHRYVNQAWVTADWAGVAADANPYGEPE
ncbi:MAG: REP-associated tyrosine transposase [Panacagrimonas sp.]